jgi:O-antigen ligase
VLLAFCAGSAIYVWVYVNNRYVQVNPYDQMALRYFACDSLAKIMLICVPMIALSENRQRMRFLGDSICSLFVLINCMVCFWQSRLGCGYNECGGMIGNPSISMGFTVCLLPVFVHSWRKQWPILALTLIAVLLSKSSVALGLSAAYAGIWLFPWRQISDWKRATAASFATVGIFAMGLYFHGAHVFHDSDRFKVWAFMLHAWASNLANIPVGMGLGTYHVISINLQAAPQSNIATNYHWNSFHNDWFEMLFCGGAVGLLLLLSTYCSALLKAVREFDWQIATSIILYGLYMCMDPALRNPLPVLFGAWLFTYALRRDVNHDKLI